MEAQPFDDSHELIRSLRAGDHIAVMSPSGDWHHGIYVEQETSSGRRSMVVEVWSDGETESASRVTWRSFGQFVSGGARFALVGYAEGSALPHEHSAALALHLRAAGCHNVASTIQALRFATLCRSLRWEQSVAVSDCLARLPAQRIQGACV